MASTYFEEELGLAGEEELDQELHLESDHESDPEADQFFGTLAKMAKSAIQSPALRSIARRAALGAAKSGLRGLGGLGGHIGGAIGGKSGSALGKDIGSALGRAGLGWLPQRELDGELWGESDGEISFEDLEVYGETDLEDPEVTALMEHLASSAAEADTEEEAFAFLAPLAPLALKAALPFAAKALPMAAKALPSVLKVGQRVLPSLTRGVQGIAKTLMQTPKSRQLIRTLPAIARQTSQQIARQAAAGRPVTPQTAVRTLAANANRTLSSPARCVHAYRRARAMDRRFHAGTRAA
jgi:hypothetical protein